MSRLFTTFLMVSASLLIALYPAFAEDGTTLLLAPGKQYPYTHDKVIERAAIGDPTVASIAVLSSRSLLLTGKVGGNTTLMIWEKDSRSGPLRMELVVTPVPQLVDGPLQAVPLLDGRLKLNGKAPSLPSHQAALGQARPESLVVDDTESDFDTQVQIDIKMVEVSHQRLMDAGFFLGKRSGGRTRAIAGPGNLTGIQPAGVGNGFDLVSESGFLPFLKSYNLVWGNTAQGVFGALSMLEADGMAYTLAEPSLTAISGQTATFLAGGEIPIPLRRGGNDNSVSIEYKEFGVRLAFTPTVLSNDRIFLKVAPEVSELDETMGVQTGGVAVPGLRVRRTDTSVALASGESFVLSGLVSRNTTSAVDKFPFLGDLPVLGAFFRSSRFDQADKELLMAVTATVVRPFAKGTELPELPGHEVHDYAPSFASFLLQDDGENHSLGIGFTE